MRVKYLAGKIAGNFRGIFPGVFCAAFRGGGPLRQISRQARGQPKAQHRGRPPSRGDRQTAGAAAHDGGQLPALRQHSPPGRRHPGNRPQPDGQQGARPPGVARGQQADGQPVTAQGHGLQPTAAQHSPPGAQPPGHSSTAHHRPPQATASRQEPQHPAHRPADHRRRATAHSQRLHSTAHRQQPNSQPGANRRDKPKRPRPLPTKRARARIKTRPRARRYSRRPP